ncbi:MAG: hypothetical protein IK143_08120 [Bacteroidales bacterium]|nr:hypothetical protein [Bacteroidales bacterium]
MRHATLLLIAALIAVACKEPVQSEKFIRSDDAERGVYIFDVELADSTSTYDFVLYTRLDGEPEALADAGYLPLFITWSSPSGLEATEKVVLPLTDGRKEHYSRQIITPYRTGFTPFETGKWQIRILPGADMGCVTGLGLRYTRKHGTR